jgi:hypothetical protein
MTLNLTRALRTEARTEQPRRAERADVLLMRGTIILTTLLTIGLAVGILLAP